ncbi:MAG: hypothetical protein Q8T08_21185 [Ignavibacteria bacterium]|jgi:hypothetical protein|nr:hypothetical protein [Ignavibacteria bacterium]
MKKLLVTIISLAFIIITIGCAEDAEPQFRVSNERTTKANVQVQTSGGNTININDVEGGKATSYQTTAAGNVTATAVIQNEQVSPSVNFYAAMGERYTIEIKSGNVPTLRVNKE